MRTIADPFGTHMLHPHFLQSHFERGHTFARYVEKGKPEQIAKWAAVHERVRLTDTQRELIRSFKRDMKVLVTSGLWCGDCSAQCPMFARIADASNHIDLRFVDRDEHADLSERIKINQGLRVPTVIFMAEDFEFVGIMGDRSITRYRAVAAKQLGAACPLPGAPIPDDELAGTLADWVNEFERIQLMLRLSPRLRERHED